MLHALKNIAGLGAVFLGSNHINTLTVGLGGDLEPLSRILQATRCATCVARSDVAATDATKQTSSGNTISLRSMLGRVESGRTTPRKRGL
jgi:hypothetical protein